jgi:hypothetical protein
MTAAQCGAAVSPARGLLPLIVLLLELPATMLARAIRGRSPFHGDGLHITTWLRRHGVPEAGVLAGCAVLTLGGSLAAVWAARSVSC